MAQRPVTGPFDNLPPVSVAGLQVPAELVPRIIAALRGVYPTVTEGLDDDAAVRAVLKYWVTVTLSSWEAQQVTAQATEAIVVAQQDLETANERSRLAREQAEADAQAIQEAPPPA